MKILKIDQITILDTLPFMNLFKDAKEFQKELKNNKRKKIVWRNS